ncbi:hypothetical protein P0W64_09845 [Tsukamurella sp. 8F]|uniref:hypothetical protein n=1 Tax=unclassified Tsukamurella TaxID=2633480 RepID=UPI0023B8AA39|nr:MULTISPECIES: hypothetical protein [unclassified Tsukamurella]MDF0529419.1 hypothetical protein [Tsukamurella sp. 8J]MDF0587074.1 hypothetical protein [Tsukamurella sp. 8F]
MTARQHAAVALIAAAALGLAGCGGDAPTTEPVPAAEHATVLSEQDGSLSAAAATRFFRSSPAAVVADGADPSAVRAGGDVAARRGIPLLTVGPRTQRAVYTALARLGVAVVYTAGAVALPELQATGVTVSALPPGTAVPEDGLSHPRIADGAKDSVVLATSTTDAGAVATARAAGAQILTLPGPDPRSSAATTTTLHGGDRPVVALGAVFGTGGQLAQRIRQAAEPSQLFGGGHIVFPGRRYVALYGVPGTPALGVLGQQDLAASIARVKKLAAQYAPLSNEPVVPAFEIIASVASSAPGPDGQYSSMTPVAQLEPWVRAAQDAGVYVTLDLQPGRTDFLTQAKAYAPLLALPNVGLALDPEWRLKPNQVHLQQIGTVDPAEVNRVQDWLAGLVRDRGIPQKVLVLHQFTPFMLGDRAAIATDHPELALVVHTDGHGTPGIKMGTWDRVRAGLSPHMFLGWKNFYTEDSPTFSPAQTMALRPQPVFVSYQ